MGSGMGGLDFPDWFGLGSYGGLACSLVCAAGVAGYALLRHRGTPRQLARASLVCLAASSLMLAPIWWNLNRLDLYAPMLDLREVMFWLSWTALAGWFVPVGMLAGYVLLAAPAGPATPGGLRLGGAVGTALAALGDAARRIEPLGAGVAWGVLVPADGEFAGQELLLTRQLTLLGRELDNDIVVDDDRTSRHHAEIHWDRGHIELVDRGSMNGTLVNRQAVRGRVPLKSGDIIELGAQRYRVEVRVSPEEARLRDLTPDAETRKMPGMLTSGPKDDPPPAPLVLAGVRGVAAGQRWPLRDRVVTIGRDRDRQICLPHESVSREHAQIVRQRSGYFVSDLHSSNGTFLNGQALTAPSLLMAGDLLRIGEVELRCELEPADVPAPASESLASQAPREGIAPGASEPPVSLAGEAPPADASAPSAPASTPLLLAQHVARADQRERPRLAPPRLAGTLPSKPERPPREPEGEMSSD
jgi:pSer/pThr/pTyr-binding forkhead associated (FHA) protein